jgi:hypothetical protein
VTQLREQIITPVGIEEAFTYAADFAHLAQWDPGVAASSRIDPGPVGEGSQFAVVVAFGSRRIPMVYTITEFDPPRRVVLVGEGSTLTAVDEITFAAVPQGTAITYSADLEFKGFMKFVAPVLGGVLRGVGRKAVAGLATALEER